MMRVATSRASTIRSWLSVSVALVLLVGATSCGRFRQTKECTVLAQTVATWLASVPPVETGALEPARLIQETRASAGRYAALDRQLAALAIKSKELAPRVQRYRSLAQQAARSLDEAALAIERNDAELARKRRVDFDTLARSEAPLVAEINAVCGR